MLTPEMEERARRTNCTSRTCIDTECRMKRELLAEIDRLRDDRNSLHADLLGQEHRLGIRYETAEKKLAIAVEALEKISIPSSIETSGLGDVQEFEELYDFWHLSSANKLNIATEALSKIRGEK